MRKIVKQLCYNCEFPAIETITIKHDDSQTTENIPCCGMDDCADKIYDWFNDNGELDCEKVTDSK